jgi:hypothetical protein
MTTPDLHRLDAETAAQQHGESSGRRTGRDRAMAGNPTLPRAMTVRYVGHPSPDPQTRVGRPPGLGSLGVICSRLTVEPCSPAHPAAQFYIVRFAGDGFSDLCCDCEIEPVD